MIEAYESDDDSGIGHAQADPQRMPTVQDLPDEDNPIPFVFKDIESEYEDRIMPYSEKMRSGKRAKSKKNWINRDKIKIKSNQIKNAGILPQLN